MSGAEEIILRPDWKPKLVRTIRNSQYEGLREGREGVMLHYDASTTDAGAMAWFSHPDCRVSYHYLVLDDGTYVEIAPLHTRAWHAGPCRSSNPQKLQYKDANSALYGIAAATNDKVLATPIQIATIAWLTAQCFKREDWPLSDGWRIVGHSSEAWKRGRKSDPEGGDPENPIYTPEQIRRLVRRIG